MKTKPDWQFASTIEPENWVKTNYVTRMMLYFAIANLLVIISALLARMYLDISGFLAFRVMLFAMVIGVVLGCLALVVTVLSSVYEIIPANKQSLMIMLLGFIPVIIAIANIGFNTIQLPMIHDISTDTSDPPEFQEATKLRTGRQNTLAYEGESIANRQQQAYPEIQPVISRMNRDEALIEATQLVKDLQWEFINIDYDKGIIEAYDTSGFFGFVDDIVIRVRTQDQGSRIDIRSVSRVGKGDMGKNAERIKRFINMFRN
jgi:uncharacterized protein (DUF1499 family)